MKWDLYSATSDNDGDSSVSVVTRLRAGWQKNRGSIPSTERDISSLWSVVTCPGVHLAPYPMSTRDHFPRDKTGAEWVWSLSSVWCGIWERVDPYIHQIKKGGGGGRGGEKFTLLWPDPTIHKRDTFFFILNKNGHLQHILHKRAETLSINNTTFISLWFFFVRWILTWTSINDPLRWVILTSHDDHSDVSVSVSTQRQFRDQ